MAHLLQMLTHTLLTFGHRITSSLFCLWIFSGFCIARAAEAIDMMQKQACSDTVKVRTETGTALWHEFERGDGDESFKAGLSGDLTRLRYDISQGRLTAPESNFRFLRGQNSKGKVEIIRNP